MRTRTRHRKKGMTALQAAILTGVSIAVALIVGYWIWTVVVGSIRTERLTLTIPSAEYTTSFTTLTATSGWQVTLKIMNNGPSDTTITDIRINGKSVSSDDYNNAVAVLVDTDGDGTADYTWTGGSGGPNIPIGAGGEADVIIELAEGTFRSGQTIEISFVTASNQVYTSSIALP